MKLIGQERPWSLPGPGGTVSVIGIVFEGNEATLDNGALHARNHLEAGVRFSEDPGARGKGERITSVWVSHSGQIAERFLGACAVEAWVDRVSSTGWKRTIDHVNRMSDAVRGKIDVADLSVEQRRSLGSLLATYAPKAWESSTEELRKALSAP